jgi:hypothetical protein
MCFDEYWVVFCEGGCVGMRSVGGEDCDFFNTLFFHLLYACEVEGEGVWLGHGVHWLASHAFPTCFRPLVLVGGLLVQLDLVGRESDTAIPWIC